MRGSQKVKGEVTYMLYVTVENHKGRVFVEADSKEEATRLVQVLTAEGGGPAYSVDLVQFPELQTATLVRSDGSRQIVEWRPVESSETAAVRRALGSAA